MSFLRTSSPRPFLRLDIASLPDDDELAAATAIRVDHVEPHEWGRTRFAWYRCGIKNGGDGLLELNLRGALQSDEFEGKDKLEVLSVYDITSLEVLLLADNRLSYIAPSVSRLEALLRLDLRRNLLTVLPIELGSLLQLTQLNLSQNWLRVIPVSSSSDHTTIASSDRTPLRLDAHS